MDIRCKAFVVGAVVLAACGEKKETKVAVADGGPAPIVSEGPPKPPPLTPKKIAPTLHEIGVEGAVPRGIAVELATPVIERSRVGETSAKTRLALTPETDGEITWTGVSTLTFVPSKPLAFGTRYKVDLGAVETRDGVVTPAEGEHWTREFTTPAFAFKRWSPVENDVAKHRLVMDLVFTGAVLPNRAKPYLVFSIDGKPTANVAFQPAGSPNIIRAVIGDPRIVLGANVKLLVKKGLPAEAEADAATAETIVSNDQAVVLHDAVLEEGAQGFYIEVICDDKAAASGSRSFYSRNGDDSYYDLSARCQLTDEALKRIELKPAVKKTYLTGGRAGFRIFGDFKRGTYSLTIPGGVTSVDGGVVLAPLQRDLSVPARKPQLSFAATGRYLPRNAWTNLGIKHMNVEAVNLFVRQVPPENLIFWLSDDKSEQADERTSDLVLRKTIPLRADADVATTTWLDVASMLPATTKGVLEVKLEAVDARAAARILLTDMSLVAKKSAPPKEPWNQKVMVWALDIDSGKLLGGVDVALVKKSGKAVARCSTDGDKGCVLSAGAADEDQSEPFAVVARKGDDLTYIRYKDLKADVGESATSGDPFTSESPYRAAVWSDRGVYRPGDTAHVVAVLRNAKDVAPDADLPVDVKLVDPRAKVVKKQVMKSNAAGLIAVDYAFPAFADTGH